MICPSCQIDNEPGSEVCFGCGKSLSAISQGAVISSRYEILGLLGKGGMGMVYRAHDRLLDEVVAIKVLRSEFVDTPEVAQRFRSEIKLARKVSHPNVCRIHEYGEDGSINYISMALIEGTDLGKLIRQHPEGLPIETAFAIALQVTEGLQAIHDVGIIHRDLKSPNVICDGSGVARLMDFGIAKDSAGSGQLTATGQVMGTPEYMSPEQCHGDALDFRSDIYSLGIVLYEIFTGRVPFRGETLMATLLKQVQDEVPLDAPETARLPAGMLGTLRKALAKDPAQRYATAAEVAAALREARKAQAPSAAAEGAGAEPGPAIPASAATPPSERRRDTRLPISVDMLLQRSTAGGAVLQEERTIADNIGRHGARVLTTMTSINVGDIVLVRQVDGDFQSRSAVRHVHTGSDRFRKLGLEFLDRAAPDHLVPSDGSHPRIPLGVPKAPLVVPPAVAAPTPPPPGPPPAPAPAPAAQTEERRKDSRLTISVDVMLRRLARSGSVLQEERTVVDNIGRHGARVLTAMTGLAVGEIVSLHEVGSDFQTRAEIRSLQLGVDKIQRLGLRFMDRATPEHLLPDGDSKPRLLPPPGVSRPGQAAESSQASLGPSQVRPTPTPTAGPAVVQGPAPPSPQPPTTAPLDGEAVTLLAEEILEKGSALLAEGKFWDAIQTLEGGLHLAPGTRTNRTLRILLAQATAKNPQWHESAEEMLVALTHESPAPLEAFIALSVLYEEKGLKARAAAQLRRVLELHPGHADALARLKALD